MKQCKKCKLEKDLDEFQYNYRMADNHLNICKSCNKEYHQNYSKLNKQTIKQCHKKWYQDNKDKVIAKITLSQNRKYQHTYIENHPLAHKARWKLLARLKKLEIKRPPCQICNNSKTEAHHPDYNKPFEVYHLCRKCHTDFHYNNLSLNNITINKY